MPAGLPQLAAADMLRRSSWQLGGKQSLAGRSSRRLTKRRRSSITELAFHGIYTSPVKTAGKCNPCVRYEMEPMSRAAQYSGDCDLTIIGYALGIEGIIRFL